jgi:hypothetical protein
MNRIIFSALLIVILDSCGHSQKEKEYKTHNKALGKEVVFKFYYSDKTTCDSIVKLKIIDTDLSKGFYNLSTTGGNIKMKNFEFLITPECGKKDYIINIDYVLGFEPYKTTDIIKINLKEFLNL